MNQCWQGLGVNYKSFNNADDDIAYFKSIGLNKVRVHLDPAAQQYADWEGLARKFFNEGFYVIWGVSVLPGTGSADDWDTYESDVIAFATGLATRSQCCTEFQVGNELELHVDGTTLTRTQLRANIRTLSTTVQGILAREYISYTCYCPWDARNWISEGIGDLDFLDINFYGNVHDDGARWRRQYFTSNDIQTVVDAFGDKVRISEFNIDSDNTKLESLSRDEQVRYTRQLYTDIRKLGVSAAYMYQYRGYRDQDNQFAVRLTTGDTKPYWDVLSTDNNRRSLI